MQTDADLVEKGSYNLKCLQKVTFPPDLHENQELEAPRTVDRR